MKKIILLNLGLLCSLFSYAQNEAFTHKNYVSGSLEPRFGTSSNYSSINYLFSLGRFTEKNRMHELSFESFNFSQNNNAAYNQKNRSGALSYIFGMPILKDMEIKNTQAFLGIGTSFAFQSSNSEAKNIDDADYSSVSISNGFILEPKFIYSLGTRIFFEAKARTILARFTNQTYKQESSTVGSTLQNRNTNSYDFFNKTSLFLGVGIRI